MKIKATEMAKAVKVAIDQNRESGSLLSEGDIDTLSLDEIITSKLADAVRIVETEASSELIDSGETLNEKVHIDNMTGKGYLVLPSDFMRLLAFRMSDWDCTIYSTISESDPEYKKQSSKWKGIYGSPAKPVVAIVKRKEGTVLEFYSCEDTSASVSQGLYLPIPKIDNNGEIEVSEKCYSASVYQAASLVLASLGDKLSTTMLEISRSLL